MLITPLSQWSNMHREWSNSGNFTEQNDSLIMQDIIAGFRCNCAEGYNGTTCANNINDCDPSPCLNGACVDMINSYSCLCDSGWTGSHCDVNIDDCISHPCHNGGTCSVSMAIVTCSYSVPFSMYHTPCSCRITWTDTHVHVLRIILDPHVIVQHIFVSSVPVKTMELVS